MVPDDTETALGVLMRLAVSRLGVPYVGDDVAIRLEFERDRGAGIGRRWRDWIDRDKTPPRQFIDLLVLLDEAGLLQPEAVAGWRGISLEEARLAVGRARDQAAMAAESQATHEGSAQGRRRTA
jgi:hypothetical protein